MGGRSHAEATKSEGGNGPYQLSSFSPQCKQLKETYQTDCQKYATVAYDIVRRVFHTVPTKIAPLQQAGAYHVLFVATVDKKDFVVRINRLPAVYRAHEFVTDAWIYSTLACNGIAVPKFIVSDISRSWCPTDFEVIEFIPGNNLKMYEDPETQWMPPELLRSVGRYVATVHNISLTGAGPLSLKSIFNDGQLHGIFDSWYAYVVTRLQEHCTLCRASGAIDAHEESIILSLFEKYKTLFNKQKACLLHGDLGNHNFISHDGLAVDALIDWEDCMSGDPVFDIAFWGTFFKDYHREHFLEGYRSVSVLPDDFELRYWLYFLRISLSKTVHRIHFGYQDRPGRPPASLRIQKALEQLRELGAF